MSNSKDAGVILIDYDIYQSVSIECYAEGVRHKHEQTHAPVVAYPAGAEWAVLARLEELGVQLIPLSAALTR